MVGMVDEVVVEYNDGGYYNYILPKYLFDGVSDTVKLENWLKEQTDGGRKKFNHILELACGGGRATKIISKYAHRVDAVDISPSQLEYAKRATNKQSNVRFVQESMFDFTNRMAETGRLQKYDFIFSFWGIFYGVNNVFLTVENNSLKALDQIKAYETSQRNLTTLFSNIDHKAKFLFFHVRSDTEE
jgi:SAM-dependent methyltransferase